MCDKETWLPFGSLTKLFIVDVIDVRREMELTMWLVSQMSMTQDIAFLGKVVLARKKC